jgi:polyhydroxyalkanoate synthesis regulator protein
VLTQIILEAKSHNNLEMLPVEFLRKLISTHDEKTATWLDGYLKAGAALLDRSVREGMELSNAYHKQLTELMQGVMPRSWGVPPKREAAGAAAPSRSEIDELRRRLDELAKESAKSR